MVSKASGSYSRAYSYDYENRFKQVSMNCVTVLQATYDGDGRRVEVTLANTTVYELPTRLMESGLCEGPNHGQGD